MFARFLRKLFERQDQAAAGAGRTVQVAVIFMT
jgi:hypothetical protein